MLPVQAEPTELPAQAEPAARAVPAQPTVRVGSAVRAAATNQKAKENRAGSSAVSFAVCSKPNKPNKELNMANKKNTKVRDMKPIKDAKGGGGGKWAGKAQGPGHTESGARPAQIQGSHGPVHQS
jgi:hypothetical protein